MNILDWLQNLFTKPRGGWDIDNEVPDDRDYKFAEAFSDDIFGAAFPEEFSWPLLTLPAIPVQGGVLSCVSSGGTFINSFNSKQGGNDVFLSWPFLYKNVPHLAGGTRVRDNLQWLVDNGQCVNNLMPENDYNGFFGSEKNAQTRADITTEMVTNALNYKISGYFKVNPRNEAEMKTAIMKAPVMIGVYTSATEWLRKPVIKHLGIKSYGHIICIRGWDKYGNWLITDWDKYEPFKLLDKRFPLELAYVILDLPDKFTTRLMKAYKLENTSEIYVVTPANKRQKVSSISQWQALNEKKLIIGGLGTITREQLNQYPVDEEPLIVAK